MRRTDIFSELIWKHYGRPCLVESIWLMIELAALLILALIINYVGINT